MHTLQLTINAPVPVGHRVEIRWYRLPAVGLLSGTRLVSLPSAPVVQDLDTGIVYGPVELFWQRGAVAELPRNQALPLQWEPIAGSEIEYQMRGKVTSCRVASYCPHNSNLETFFIQTTLVVEPEASR